MQRRLNRLCELGACATAHANFHKTVWIMLNVCFFTVNKFPLRNAFNFVCTNQQFHSPISVCVVEVLTNVAFGKLLKYSHPKKFLLLRIDVIFCTKTAVLITGGFHHGTVHCTWRAFTQRISLESHYFLPLRFC